MSTVRKSLLALAFAVVVGGLYVASEILLDEPNERAVALTLRDIRMDAVVSSVETGNRGWTLEGDIAATADGLLLVQSGNTIHDLISGEPLINAGELGLKGFTTIAGGVVAICGQWICTHGDDGLEPALRLPPGEWFLGPAGDENSFHLFGELDGRWVIYRVVKGGGHAKLVATETPILAVTGWDDALLFALGAQLFTIQSGGEPAKLLDLGKSAPITAIAVDPGTGLIYFSVGEGVFALIEDSVVMVLAGITGDLVFNSDVLFVKDRMQRSVVAIGGASEAVIGQWQQTKAMR